MPIISLFLPGYDFVVLQKKTEEGTTWGDRYLEQEARKDQRLKALATLTHVGVVLVLYTETVRPGSSSKSLPLTHGLCFRPTQPSLFLEFVREDFDIS